MPSVRRSCSNGIARVLAKGCIPLLTLSMDLKSIFFRMLCDIQSVSVLSRDEGRKTDTQQRSTDASSMQCMMSMWPFERFVSSSKHQSFHCGSSTHRKPGKMTRYIYPLKLKLLKGSGCSQSMADHGQAEFVESKKAGDITLGKISLLCGTPHAADFALHS